MNCLENKRPVGQIGIYVFDFYEILAQQENDIEAGCSTKTTTTTTMKREIENEKKREREKESIDFFLKGKLCSKACPTFIRKYIVKSLDTIV